MNPSPGRDAYPGSVVLGLVDPFRAGHHEVLLDALLGCTVAAGRPVVVAAPADGPAGRWGHRHPDLVQHVPVALTAVDDDPDHLERVYARCSDAGVRRVVLLSGGQYLHPVAPPLPHRLPTTFVVHRLKGLAAPSLRRVRAWPVVRARRRRLGVMAAAPHRLVVHTPAAVQLAARHRAGATRAHVPVPAPPPRPDVEHDRRRVAFIGGLRPWKGAGLLGPAWSALATPPVLEIAGNDAHDDPAAVAALAPHPVERRPGSQPRAVIEELFARAAVVLAPYDGTYPGTGAAATVPLEALVRRTPVVVSEAIADQLPPGRPGAVVVPTGDAAGVARGIEEALDRLDELTEATGAAARWIAEHHRVDRYLDAIG